MTASQNRAQARKNLAGKWGKVALLTLVFGIITYVISWILAFVPIVGPIASALISPALSFGFLMSLFKINDGQETGYMDFLGDGFSKFGKVWSVALNTLLKLIIPVIFFIVALILLTWSSTTENSTMSIIAIVLYIVSIIWLAIKSFAYTLALYVAYDNPEMSGKEAVEKSAELMNGNIWSYICLNLSFIGWAILGIFTLCIGYLWLIPYMKTTEINFYRNLAGNVVENETTPEE